MAQPPQTKLLVGDWQIDPASGEISRKGQIARLDIRAMRLVLCLAARPGEVVSIDDLINQVWAGVIVTSDSVYQAVASLRRVLGDDAKQPIYIATVPRLGYRMVAQVNVSDDPPAVPTGRSPPPSSEASTWTPDRAPSVGLRRYARV